MANNISHEKTRDEKLTMGSQHQNNAKTLTRQDTYKQHLYEWEVLEELKRLKVNHHVISNQLHLFQHRQKVSQKCVKFT